MPSPALPSPSAELVAAAYDAALDPLGWLPLLRRLSDETAGIAGGFSVQDYAAGTGIPFVSHGYDQAGMDSLFRHYLPLNPLHQLRDRLRPGTVGASSRIVAPEVFRRGAFYNEWAAPRDFLDSIFAVVHRSGTRFAYVTVNRPHRAGPARDRDLAVFEALVPHLERAVRVSEALRQVEGRAEALTATLDRIGLGAILVDAAGRLAWANPPGEALLRAGGALSARRGHLSASEPGANRDLQAALPGTGSPGRAADLVLTSEEGAVPLTVVPLPPGSARPAMEGERRPAAMLLATPPSAARPSRADTAARLWGLTAAEARLLRTLLDLGGGLRVAAERLGVKEATARTHLGRVFGKSGTARQAELLRTVAALPA